MTQETTGAITPPVEREEASRPAPAPAAGPVPAGSGFPNAAQYLLEVSITVSVEVGRVQMPLRQVMELQPGSVVELQRAASEPVEMYANGRCIGRGEIVVVGDLFGIRVTELGSDS